MVRLRFRGRRGAQVHRPRRTPVRAVHRRYESDYKSEAKLKDGDYTLHLWNVKPSPAAENARWEVVGS